MKQTITLYHESGAESTLEIEVSEDNPITEVELSVVWDDDVPEIDFSSDLYEIQ